MTQSTDTETAPTMFNPADYPRTYTYSKKDRYAVTAICLVLFALAAITHFFSSIFQPLLNKDSARIVLPFLFSAVGCALLIFPWTARLTLGPDYIESRVLYIFRRCIKREDIVGYKTKSYRWLKFPNWLVSHQIILISIDAYRRNLNISRFEQDAFFEEWYASLPNYKVIWRNAIKRLSIFDRFVILWRPEITIVLMAVVVYWPAIGMPSLSTSILTIILLIPPLCVFLALTKPEKFVFFDPAYHSFLFNTDRPKIDLAPVYGGALMFVFVWSAKHELLGIIFPPWYLWPNNLAHFAIFLILLAGLLLPLLKSRGFFNLTTLQILLASLIFLPLASTGINFILNVRFPPSPPTIINSYSFLVTSVDKIDTKLGRADELNVKLLKPSSKPSKSPSFLAAPNRFKKDDIICVYKYTGLFHDVWGKYDLCPKQVGTNHKSNPGKQTK